MSKHLSIVLRFSSLGDLVLTSAFVNKLGQLRSDDADHRILYVTLDQWGELVREYFPSKKLSCYTFAKPRGLWNWFRQGMRLATFIKENNLGTSKLDIFDLHNVGKSKFLIWGFRFSEWKDRYFSRSNSSHWTEAWDLNRPRTIKSTPKYRWRRFLSLYLKREDSFLQQWPVFARHQMLLESRAPSDCSTPCLNIFHKSLPDPSTYKVILVVDAQNWKKKWPTEFWKELLVKLSEVTSTRLSLTLVASSKETVVTPEIDWRHHEFKDLQGRTTLSDLPLIAEASDLVVCGNSAWLHIAESVNTPVLTLSGPIVSEFGFHPWRRESVTLERKMWCRPCTLHGKGLCYNPNRHACMKEITPLSVFTQISHRMNKR